MNPGRYRSLPELIEISTCLQKEWKEKINSNKIDKDKIKLETKSKI